MLNVEKIPRLGPSLRKTALALSIVTGLTIFGALAVGAIVPEQPRLDTPIVLDGEVWTTEQVGNAIVVGGNFTQIQTERDGPVIDQAGIFAYDLDSGILLEDFLPTLISTNGVVDIRDLEPAADGRSVYIGGRFNSIDDKTDGVTRIRNRLAKLDVTSGRLDRNFALSGVDAVVLALELVGSDLYVGGNFTTIFDTSTGPQLQRDHHSFARFDATTGAYDPTFKFEPEVTLQRDGLLGVTNIEKSRDNNWVLISHRGQFIEAADGTLFERPGIAFISTAGAVGGFRALHPDPNDPVQDMYHRGMCGGRGIIIRDLEVDPAGQFFVLTHQGADTGAGCDTVVRYQFQAATPARPDWVSRVFDSVFSAAITNDAIYIGGHFRYLAHPSAPSPYPGETRPSNDPLTGNIYVADPERDETFAADLVDPGFVFPVNQFGALNPATGYGIPSFDPGSDAFLGILELTAIDRGLLIGQDGSRINGFNVGRTAILDLDPTAGDPQCTVTLDGDLNPVVSWTDIGNVNLWNVARNGTFQASLTSTSFNDLTSPIDTDLSYELRFNRNGIAQTDDCGVVRIDSIPITCTVEARPDGSLRVDWNNVQTSSYTVLRDGEFRTSTVGDVTRWDDDRVVPNTTYTYEVQAVRNGTVTHSATCSATTPNLAVVCSAVLAGDQATISFNGDDFDRVTIRRDGSWQATIDDANTFTQTLTPGTYAYEARGVINGAQINQSCGTVTLDAPATPVVTCSVSVLDDVATVSFNGDDFNRVTIRRDGSWQATIDNANTYTETLNPGTYAYEARGIGSGFIDTADCGTITVDAPPPAIINCTVALVGNEATLSFNGDDFNRVTIRRDGSWQATIDDANTFTQTLTPGTYVYTARGIGNGTIIDTNCGTVTVDAAPGPVLTCNVTITGNNVLLTWNDLGANSYQVRTNGSWTASLPAGTVIWEGIVAAGGNNNYQIRFRLNGEQTTVDCA